MCRETHMSAKQTHCTPSWAIPSRPARHSNVSTVLQHAMSWREGPTVRMLAKPHVAEAVPRSTHQGEMPSDVPREMMR